MDPHFREDDGIFCNDQVASFISNLSLSCPTPIGYPYKKLLIDSRIRENDNLSFEISQTKITMVLF